MRVVLGLLACAMTAGAATASDVVTCRVEDTIQPASQMFLERCLEEAADRRAELVVLELDTPGGLLTSTREITTAITTSPVPVAVLVSPGGAQAASAGFFILLSADVAAMSPGTNTGAASPVTGQGEDVEETMKAKVFNDAAAMARSLAERRGRNVDLAVEAVTEATSFSADEALENGIVEHVVVDVPGLLEVLHGREITRFDGSTTVLDLGDPNLVEVEQTSFERVLSLLASPQIAYLLLGLASIGLMVEIYNPGSIFPGVVGVICLLLGLYGVSVLPVNWAGVALIAVALVLFMLEVKIVSYGMLTVGGLISFVLGSLMLFDGPIPAMRVSLGVVLPTALVVAALTILLLSRVVAAHRSRPMTGVEGLVGEEGRALTGIEAEGKVGVHGEYWDARSAGRAISRGEAVRVVEVGSRRLTVEPVEETNDRE